MRKLTVSLKVLRQEGPKALYYRVRRFTTNRMLDKRDVRLSVKTEDILQADWTHLPPAPAKKVKPPFTINWVIPPPGAGSGGHLNIFRFVRYLEGRGHTMRLYFYDPYDHQPLSETRAILDKSFPAMKAAISNDAHNMEPADAVFATAWQTAYPVFNWQTDAKKFYFVQDFEPYFYPVGSESVLAENTYRFGFHGVTAGGWLTKKLSTEYGMKCDYYDFGSDSDRYHYDNDQPRRKLVFYSRPVTPRRAFELGVLTLELFARQHPEFEIVMVGWDISDYTLPFKATRLAVLKLDELNELYNQAAVALVLSLTNMSLLPLELLSSGCIPVVNDAENNRLVSNNEFIEYAAASPKALADALHEVVSRPNLPDYAKRASASVKNLDWDESGAKVEAVLKRELNG